MKQRGVGWRLVVVVLAFLLIPLALAPSSCIDDSECALLGPEYTCDPLLFECVSSSAPLPSVVTTCILDDDCLLLGSDYACDVFVGECVLIITPDTIIAGPAVEPVAFEASEPSLEDQLAVLQNRFVVLDSRVSALETSESSATLDELRGQYVELKSQVEALNTQVQMITFNTQQNLDTALAGLATLQEELSGTQYQLSEVEEEIAVREAKAAKQRLVALALVALLVFVAILYYVLSHKKGHVTHNADIPLEVRTFITKEVSSGKKYAQIRSTLLKNGWKEKQIRSAYGQITQENYDKYLASQGKTSGKGHFAPHQTKKIIAITAITLIILGVFIFFVSNAVGQAYYTGIPQAEFSVLAKGLIEDNIENNPFYTTLAFADICVQVTEIDLSESYRIIKTPAGNAITIADVACDANPTHDFALKFTNWNTFNTIIGGVNCATGAAAHATGGVYVLPSKYVATGFTTTSLDYSNFCAALNVCSSQLPVATLIGSLGC